MKSFDVAAVVTGGASGLGEATTRALAAEGAAVTILDLQEDRGQALAAELGGHTTFVRTDVTDEASVQAAIADATGKDRPLRIAVNCAGIGWAQRTVGRGGEPHDLGAFVTTVMVNLVGTFNVLRLAAAAMAHDRARRGRRARRRSSTPPRSPPTTGRSARSPTRRPRAGSSGMTLPAARDLSSVGVRVCTIAPGLVDTPLLGSLPEEARAGAVGGHTLPEAAGPARRLRRARAGHRPARLPQRRGHPDGRRAAHGTALTSTCLTAPPREHVLSTATAADAVRPRGRLDAGLAAGPRPRAVARTGAAPATRRMRVGRRRRSGARRRPPDGPATVRIAVSAGEVRVVGVGSGRRAGRGGGARLAGRRRPARRVRPGRPPGGRRPAPARRGGCGWAAPAARGTRSSPPSWSRR